jgi:hypothetical protein
MIKTNTAIRKLEPLAEAGDFLAIFSATGDGTFLWLVSKFHGEWTSVGEILSQTAERYTATLPPNERKGYLLLPDYYRDAYRVFRGMAVSSERGEFFLSYGNLAILIGTCQQNAGYAAWKLRKYGVVEIKTKGAARTAMNENRTTEWRWLVPLPQIRK